MFFCHRGDNEIGGFGITPGDDLLFIEEFATVNQAVTGLSVAFDDGAVADFFDAQIDAGRKPEQFARTWLHTHPGNCPEPSAIDEETFARVFGRCDWAVMFILARHGRRYARLRFNTGPGGEILIPARVDFTRAFPGSDHEAWEAEYNRNIRVEPARRSGDRNEVRRGTVLDDFNPEEGLDDNGSPTQTEDTQDLIDWWERESEVWP